MRKWFLGLVIIGLSVAGLSLHLMDRISDLDQPISETDKSFTVDIARGMTFKQVVILLEKKGVLQDPLVFEWYGRYAGLGSHIQPGRYQILPHWTAREVLAAITTQQQSKTIRVHIPVGWNRWQIAERMSSLGLVDADAFLRRVRIESLEGQLFPGSYTFDREVNTDGVIDQMVKKFEAEWTNLTQTYTDRFRLTEQELLILASIVQKESVVYEDQRKVSRVFYNRLKKGQKLQTDPTCTYGPNRHHRKPNPKDCRDSTNTYSTYVIKGLPPGPIGNPGRQAIRATLLPYSQEGADKLFFFVARRDGSGQHHFTETYAEHKRADRKARKQWKKRIQSGGAKK